VTGALAPLYPICSKPEASVRSASAYVDVAFNISIQTPPCGVAFLHLATAKAEVGRDQLSGIAWWEGI
jgi:hypothetical protein